MLKDSIRENIDADEMSHLTWHSSVRWNKQDMKILFALLAEFVSLPTVRDGPGGRHFIIVLWFQDYISARSLVQQNPKIHSIALYIYILDSC